MSTAPAGRPGRGQPDWLRAKYARQPVNPRVAAWADRTIAILAALRVPGTFMVISEHAADNLVVDPATWGSTGPPTPCSSR
jgi:hypothetical protein